MGKKGVVFSFQRFLRSHGRLVPSPGLEARLGAKRLVRKWSTPGGVRILEATCRKETSSLSPRCFQDLAFGSTISCSLGRLAQLVRASHSHCEGRRFESSNVHQSSFVRKRAFLLPVVLFSVMLETILASLLGYEFSV